MKRDNRKKLIQEHAPPPALIVGQKVAGEEDGDHADASTDSVDVQQLGQFRFHPNTMSRCDVP